MSSKVKEPEILTDDLRKTLKEMFQKELEALPDTLSKLEPKERLNILIKLMPFVIPKVEAVHHKVGEPDTWGL